MEEQHAYEPYGRGLLGAMVSYMGSGADQSQYWTTSALWEHLFKSFAHNGNLVSADGRQSGEEEWINLIDVSGVVNKDGSVSLDPSYQYEGLWEDVDEPDGKGYFAVLLDKDEKELQKVEFGVSFTSRSNPPRNIDKAPFSVTLEYPQDTKFLEIRYGTQTIYRGEVSGNKPEVSFSPISASGELSGKHIIEWRGEDKDGDKLYYELWYSPDEDDWMCLAKDISETSFEVDFDTLPGGNEAIFHLYATDGINTTYTESESFSVAYKAPQIMTEQEQPEVLKITDEIYFEVDVYDPQDGYMYEPEGQIVWKDEKGEIVSEDYALLFYPYELPIGEHTFTMTATNSGGKTVSREYRFLIENDESALPQGWSREDVKQAMILGLVDPSLMYGYANNASKMDLAITAVKLYYQLADEIEDVELSEEAPYVDCEDKDGYAELAVKYGFLTVNGDKFEPQKLVTRSEAVDTFCKVINKAGFEVDQDKEFAKEYTDIATLAGVSRANMAFLNSHGIINWYGNYKLAPFDFATREQIIVIAKNIVNKILE